MVKDKINYRSRGPRTSLTRQTVQGRANEGGLRVGEMERDALISHGIARFLNESMLVRGDQYYIAVCNISGSLAIYNENKNLFLSPMVDGPIQFINNIPPHEIGELTTISQYGRDFSILKVPYSFKLLLQELLTMNVSLKLITEDNIDQLTNLSYSQNIKQLMLDKKSSETKESTFKPIKLNKNALDDLSSEKKPETEAKESEAKPETEAKESEAKPETEAKESEAKPETEAKESEVKPKVNFAENTEQISDTQSKLKIVNNISFDNVKDSEKNDNFVKKSIKLNPI
jgi:DNA-directed RNA polymerase II subunit RPB2